MPPTVDEADIISTAGQSLSVQCRFQMTDNLIRPPSVQWVNSAGSVLSDTSTLSFFPLLTSHGGKYTCTVTITIRELNILLTGEGNTTVTVQSKRLNGLVMYMLNAIIITLFYDCLLMQFLLHMLLLKKLICHSMVQSTSSHVV